MIQRIPALIDLYYKQASKYEYKQIHNFGLKV